MISNKFKIALKGNIKAMFNYFGLEIRRKIKDKGLSKGQLCHLDVYSDQINLLKNREVRVIFDIGANIGQTAMKYQKIFETSIIYCFEPFGESFLVLSETFKNIDFVKPYKLAVNNQTGTKRFYFNKTSFTNSLLRVANDSSKYVDTNLTDNVGCLYVETIKLDDFCNNENINQIQILKMDIQGTELMALKGAPHLLKNHFIDLIYTEVLFAHLYQGQAYFFDLCEFLAQYGYILYGLYNLNYGKNSVLAWGDAIFISPKIEESLNS